MASKKLSVLLAEDEKDLRDIYTLKFKKEGFSISEAKDGKEALDMLESGTLPDVMLLDLLMPKVSGYEVLEKIKANEKLSHIPVFILSNLGQEHEIKEAFRLQADKYLIKAHYTPEQVVQKIKDYFQK